jgi:predicted ATPase
MQTTGVNRSEPMALCYLAEALALNGAAAEGLRVVAAALAEAQASGTHWGDADLHRLRGDLLGRLPSNDCSEVETYFRTALAVAPEQGTRGFELRAAVSLARLLSAQGRREPAHELLAPVYGWFTEVSTLPILKVRRRYSSRSMRS